MRFERIPIAGLARSCDANSRAAKVRDPLATLGNKVSSRNASDSFIVGADETRRNAGNRAVNQYEWDFSLAYGVKQFKIVRSLCRRHDQAIDLACHQGFRFLFLQHGIFFKVRNDDVIFLRPHRFSHRLGDLGKKGVGEIRQQQADGIGAARD